ncbi:hypothetical protein VTK73DRAFT_1826 [Phialemonium thermophilum]|uniref:Response regulatory domain-containing protein n=1 Tax=Phialemonium thermophilum TaxID=223376 RepID=A0ABR3VSW1_9PEZI
MLFLERVHDVDIAVDGHEAYQKVKACMEDGKSFDIIFMDIQMPEVDGLESTRRIRRMGYTAPIVALSAFTEEGFARECSEAGVDRFMSKPITRKAVREVLRCFGAASSPTAATTANGEDKDAPVGQRHDIPNGLHGTAEVH